MTVAPPLEQQSDTGRSVVRAGFHDGELAVQRQAGSTTQASRLRSMLDPADLRGGPASFLSAQTFAVLSGRDYAGRLWLSPLTGPPGFLSATSADVLQIRSRPRQSDPLHLLPEHQQVGLLVIDFARRRRFRINGWLAATARSGPSSDFAGLRIEADQAYGNCPQYIQQRELAPVSSLDPTCTVSTGVGQETPTDPGAGPSVEGATDYLTGPDIAQIATTDTFFLATTHPERGGDASHRGGTPGFVRILDDRRLWWPDFPGNNMFNSLGNLAVDPACALLCCDFTTGRTLHVSGTAALELTIPGTRGDDGGTGRRINFKVEQSRRGSQLAVGAGTVTPYPRNFRVTD